MLSYGKIDLWLVSFSDSPVSFFKKLKMFQPFPLELLVPAVVRGNTQNRYRDMTFTLQKATFTV